MALSTETVNTVLSGLRGPLGLSFARRDPLWKALYLKNKVRQTTGSMIERSFTGAAPARGVGIMDGFELLDMTRPQNIRRFRVEPARLVVASNIPKRELDMAQGENAKIDIMQDYPQAVIMGMKSDIDSYILQGVSRGIVFATAELRRLLTLNGQITTGNGTGVTDGMLDFVAPAAQTQTVQDVAKSQADFHFNQFADIPAWAGQGMRTLRIVMRSCSAFADDGGGPDLCFMDPDVYANFEESKLSQVRVTVVEDKTEKTDTMELTLCTSKVYYSPSLLRANFTGVAADGVTYFINTDYIEMPVLKELAISNYTERVGDQDVITAHAEWHGNTIARRTPPQGCVSGGAA